MDSSKTFIQQNYQIITQNGIACHIGFGAYGCVQLAKCLRTKQIVAIKKICGKTAQREIQAHKKLNHTNILKMLDYHFDQKQKCTYIVLEYAQNGTLLDYILQNGPKDKRMIKGIFQSVCQAIQYMHAKNIMHRDIKVTHFLLQPENILLNRKNVVKLCDFGLAVKTQSRMTLCGTIQYTAPEMILRKPYSHKVDVWGLGILLFEMIEGRAPFQGTTQDEVLSNMKKPLHFSNKFCIQEIELIHKILKVDPDKRPQIKDILKSCYLNSSKRVSQQIEKRSTADEQVKISKEKIKMIQVINLNRNSNEKMDNVDKKEKKKSLKANNLKVTQNKDLNVSTKLQITNQQTVPIKFQKTERSIVSIAMLPMFKQKISLRRTAGKN